MASAAFLLSATSSAAWSTVRLPSWLMTDITMSIIICRRRILRCSSTFSWGDWVAGGELSVWQEDSSLRSDSLDPIGNTLPPDFNESYTGTSGSPTQKRWVVTFLPVARRSPKCHLEKRKWRPGRRCERSGFDPLAAGRGLPIWDGHRDCGALPKSRHTWAPPRPGKGGWWRSCCRGGRPSTSRRGVPPRSKHVDLSPAERKAAAGGHCFDRNVEALGLGQEGLVGRDVRVG